MPIRVRGSADALEAKQIVYLNALEILSVLGGEALDVEVDEGEYRNKGTVHVVQEVPDDESEEEEMWAAYEALRLRLGGDWPDREEMSKRDWIVHVTAEYDLRRGEDGLNLHVLSARRLPQSDWLTYDYRGRLVSAATAQLDPPDFAVLDNKRVPVLTVDPYEATGITSEVIGGLQIAENSFPPEGAVLLMIRPFFDEEERKSSRASLREVAQKQGKGVRIPGPGVYERFYNQVVAIAEYSVSQRGPDEWSMDFLEVAKVPPFFIGSDGLPE